jgi:hypothetical protein
MEDRAMATFTKLEKAFSNAVQELEKAMMNVRGIRVVRSVRAASPRQHRRQRGLTKGILGVIAKSNNPVRVSDIVKGLSGFGYKVRKQDRVKLSVSQTLHRLLHTHRVARSGRGLYAPAATS